MKIVLIVGLILIGTFVVFVIVKSRTPKAKANPEIYYDLRNRVFSLDPDSIGIKTENGKVYCVVMDFAVGETPVTLVSFLDGSTSLYFGNGGGVIGCGEHENVKKATLELIQHANLDKNKLEETTDYSVSIGKDESRIYMLTPSTNYQTKALRMNALMENKEVLSGLFIKANDVVTQIRLTGKI